MRIAVTGANGLVGSRLCAQLVESPHSVVAFGRREKRLQVEVEFVSLELADERAVEVLVASKPDAIINTASMTEVDACEKRPEEAFAANVLVAANVAKAARRLGAHLVHLSTDYVFDGQHGPYDEEAVPNPRGVYAITKHMGEQAVRTLAPSWAIARTAVVYGWPPSARPNFGSWLVSSLRERKPVRLFSDQFVSPSLALNVAEMALELATERLTGVWNLCGATVVNRVEFGLALCDVFGFERALVEPSRMLDLALAAHRPARTGLKVDKARRELTAQPLELHAALERFRAEVERSGRSKA